MGRMVLTLLGMVAEMELGSASSVIGNALASMPLKQRGGYKGRPATFDRARCRSARKEGMGAPKSPGPSVADEGTFTRR